MSKNQESEAQPMEPTSSQDQTEQQGPLGGGGVGAVLTFSLQMFGCSTPAASVSEAAVSSLHLALQLCRHRGTLCVNNFGPGIDGRELKHNVSIEIL